MRKIIAVAGLMAEVFAHEGNYAIDAVGMPCHMWGWGMGSGFYGLLWTLFLIGLVAVVFLIAAKLWRDLNAK